MNPSLGMEFEPLYLAGAIVGWRVTQPGRETVEASSQVEAYWAARKAARR